MPISAWVAVGACCVAIVGIFLPWSREQAFGFFWVTLNGLQKLNAAGLILYYTATITPSIVLAYRLGYRSWMELMPSGPPREVPGLRSWIIGPAIVLILISGSALMSSDEVQAGPIVAIVAAVVLAASSISNYEVD